MSTRTLTGARAATVPDAPAEVRLDGASLTPDAVRRIARDRVRVTLTDAARRRNRQARASLDALLAAGEEIYGASTGVGALRDRPVPASEREALQWNLLRSHAVDAGPALAAEVVRAGMAVRANQLGAGGAGVAPELLDGLVEALAWADTPTVGALGALGTGDLPGLARIALSILGDRAGQEPARAPALGARDALGFISSNALTLGRCCLLCCDADALHGLWLDVAALSFEASGADPVVLSARVHPAGGAAGASAVAARLRSALGLSDAARNRGERSPGASRSVQDAYPFRVLPQVDGVSAEAIASLRALLERELNARAENALIDGGRAWPNGNFHAAALTAAVDGLRSALAGSAALIAARVSALLDPAQTGLPAFLAGAPGRDSGLMMIEYAAHAAAAEVRSLAAATLPHLASLSHGVEAHAPLAPVAAARLAEQLPALRVLVGAELVIALRACELSGRRPRGPRTSALYERARRALPSGLADRDFGGDLAAADRLLAAALDSA